MWLLNAETYELKNFFESDLPSYAILSHTWGEGEVTFRDLCEADCQSLPGFRKIELCCAQALRNGLSWAWVDTCCIDKSSSAELSEAINSMYRWYKQSTICYAFLSDVHNWDRDGNAGDNSRSFVQSRWFTRGWTLQELLAPTKMIFYDAEWSEIGDRWSLATIIEESTGIPVIALEKFEPSAWRVCSKMAWDGRRKTTRTEDCAYSLLGIFEVNMPLLYGEGERAFERLQEVVFESTKDMTIFSWDDPTVSIPGLLAPSPASFENCHGRTSKGSVQNDLNTFKESHNPTLSKAGLQFSTELHPCGMNIFWMQISEYRIVRHVSWHPYKYFHEIEEYLCILQISPRVFRRVKVGDSMLFTRRKLQMKPRGFDMLYGYKFNIVLLGAGNAQSRFIYQNPRVKEITLFIEFYDALTPGIFNLRSGLQRVIYKTTRAGGVKEHLIYRQGSLLQDEYNCLFFRGTEKSFKILFLVEKPIILDCDREIIENGFQTSIDDYIRQENGSILPARKIERKHSRSLHDLLSRERSYRQLSKKGSLLAKRIENATEGNAVFSIRQSTNWEILIVVERGFAVCESRYTRNDYTVEIQDRWIFLDSDAARTANLI